MKLPLIAIDVLMISMIANDVLIIALGSLMIAVDV
jgi:hypothetical protein